MTTKEKINYFDAVADVFQVENPEHPATRDLESGTIFLDDSKGNICIYKRRIISYPFYTPNGISNEEEGKEEVTFPICVISTLDLRLAIIQLKKFLSQYN